MVMNPRLSAVLAVGGLLNIYQCVTAVPSVEVVLAHHTEDISWTKEHESGEVDFTVYSKGPNPPIGSVILPNVGRESQTFLYHIVHRYNRLADWTVFSQAVRPSWGYHGGGEVSGHLSDNVEFTDYLRPFPDGRDSFFVLNAASQFPSARQSNRIGFMIKDLNESAMTKTQCPPQGADGWTSWWWDDGHPHLWGKQSDITMLQFYHRFIAQDDYSEEPLTLTFAQGARFAVSRERIHSRPRGYYKALLEQLSKSAMPMEGYWMEASWYDVFHPEALQSKYQLCALPAFPPPEKALTIAEMQTETYNRTLKKGLILEEKMSSRRILTKSDAYTTPVPTQEPQKTVEGSVSLSFDNDPRGDDTVMNNIKTAFRETIASLHEQITADNVRVTSVDAARRLASSSRRLATALVFGYTITLPQGVTAETADSISTTVASKPAAELTTTMGTALTNAGVSGYTATVTGITATVPTSAPSTQAPSTQAPTEPDSSAHGLNLGLSAAVAMLALAILPAQTS